MAKLFKQLAVFTLCLISAPALSQSDSQLIRESFFEAIKLGNIEEVKRFIATYPDLVHETYTNEYPLLYFVRTQALPDVKRQLIDIISAKRLQIRLEEIASLGWRVNN